ncbi:MAG: pitrilysin family protein [Gemmatimonadota bacterium]|nr:MAG: pitrilysin family protein [Gemmatimonadota bacterium]
MRGASREQIRLFGCYRFAATLIAVPLMPQAVWAQAVGLGAVRELQYEKLEFTPTRPDLYELDRGVKVLYLQSRTLPLVSVFARFRGGPSNFPRSLLGAATALPSLLRSAGTTSLSPDSVDHVLEFYGIQTAFGGGGRSAFTSLNTLARHLPEAIAIWTDMLRNPGFDSASVEVWRGQELEDVRRRADRPGRLAISQFNHLMYGDHPVGWEMAPEDLTLESMSPAVLHEVHRQVFCPENLTLGVSGDVSWDHVKPLLDQMLEGWPSCPGKLPDPPLPDFTTEPGVYLIARELDQSTVIVGHPSDVHLEDSHEYFSSRIAHSIFGASGLSSRLVKRVRTEEGYSYSASSVWTTPVASRGIVGAMTRTKPESTVEAIRAILEVIERMRQQGPSDIEVRDAVDRIANGFVFNFQDPSQVVSRQMLYASQGLPLDWLARYLRGIQAVSRKSVWRTFADNVDPSRMVILILGDPDRLGPGLEELGPVTVIETPGRSAPPHG